MFKYDVIWTNLRNKTLIPLISDIISDYIDHSMTMKDIASKYNTTYHSIDTIISKNNIPKMTISQIHLLPNVISKGKGSQKLTTDEHLKDAIKMYESGEVLEKIGAKYNISARGLQMKFRKMGIVMRTLTESSNLPTTLERKKETYMDRYGVENPMQHPDIHHKSNINRYKFKAVDIHGRRFSHLQGYEPQGITYAIEELNIDVNDIQSGRKVPKVRYKFQGKNKMYYPDLYIENQNLLIEIKCEYTYNDMLDLNIAKREASIKAGFNYKTIIFDRLGKSVVKIF